MWFWKKDKHPAQSSANTSVASLIPTRGGEEKEKDSSSSRASTLPDNVSAFTSETLDCKEMDPVSPRSQRYLEVESDVAARVNFPWSVWRLTPNGVDRPPFPRYGHTLSTTTTPDGDLWLFGGLVGESSLSKDVYAITPTREKVTNVRKVKTTGNMPKGRTGSASALVGRVLVVWGGDTQVDINAPRQDAEDDALYLLNLVSLDWSKVDIAGPRPKALYGHVSTTVGSKFIVFGGQMKGEFFGDLWILDLALLKSTPVWEHWAPTTDTVIAPRTGHVCVVYDGQIIVFGGTDGQYHYNDTWAFDLQTRQWTELQCIGFIPSAREGHAAAIVDDIMYIFGGRGLDGRDLRDLVALRLTDKRWFMFQNMGPQPFGRSGHAIASIDAEVFVFGGNSSPPSTSEDWSTSQVLDTKLIKYPQSQREPRQKAGPGTAT